MKSSREMGVCFCRQCLSDVDVDADDDGGDDDGDDDGDEDEFEDDGDGDYETATASSC